ncbi:MAG: inorganic diphosphatase [Candidatus Woesearchaeota archaeon]
MNLWHDLSLGDEIPEVVSIVVEIPKGSNVKYELDKDTGLISLDRFLHSAVYYPGDYGFLPRTYCDDGDPLDVLILTNTALVPGTVARVRVIGVMKMIDGGEEDDKLIAVYSSDPRFKNIKSIKDVSEHTLEEVKHFFATYKALEKKEVEIKGLLDAGDAKKVLLESVKLYDKEFNK